jgi:hypothetical protein
MRHLGVGYKAAGLIKLIKYKLLQTMLLREQPRCMNGRVQIDDAVIKQANRATA